MAEDARIPVEFHLARDKLGRKALKASLELERSLKDEEGKSTSTYDEDSIEMVAPTTKKDSFEAIRKIASVKPKKS